jgi:hypothetical protein
MTRGTDTTARVHLALSNRDIVGVAVSKAVADGAEVDDVCVRLLDMRDPVARGLAAALLQRSSELDLDAGGATRPSARRDPDRHRRGPSAGGDYVVRGNTPRVLPTRSGVSRLSDRVRVVAVSEGGATLLHLSAVPVGVGFA